MQANFERWGSIFVNTLPSPPATHSWPSEQAQIYTLHFRDVRVWHRVFMRNPWQPGGNMVTVRKPADQMWFRHELGWILSQKMAITTTIVVKLHQKFQFRSKLAIFKCQHPHIILSGNLKGLEPHSRIINHISSEAQNPLNINIFNLTSVINGCH